MLTVREAARRTGRDPETIRRWIRAGKLRALREGRRQLIDEADLDVVVEEPGSMPLPPTWGTLPSGAPAPDWVKALHEARRGR